MKKYLVIGVYADDNSQRYATTVEADSPAMAEEVAQRVCGATDDATLIVAGTIEVTNGQELTMAS